MLIYGKHLANGKDKMATKVKQNAKKVDKDEGSNNNNNFVMPQTIITERKEGFKTSMSGVAIVTKRRQLPSSHSSTCLPVGERTDQNRLSLLLSEESEPDLFNKTFCSRCDEGRSKSQGYTRFDAYRQGQMHHKIYSTDFKHVNFNSDDTRLVDGLLTTTLCSTEL